MEKNSSADTLLHYVTTGVLLQKLVKQKSLNEYTHIIIDEVHERDQDMDFLLLVVRKFLFLQQSGVKVKKNFIKTIFSILFFVNFVSYNIFFTSNAIIFSIFCL